MPPPVVLPAGKIVDEEVSHPCSWTSMPASQVIGQVSSVMGFQRPPPGTSRTFSDPQIDSVIPFYGEVALDQTQRLSYYDTLSRVLGPATGVQENIGTYGAYMAKQAEIYYEQLLPGDPTVASVAISVALPSQDVGISPSEHQSQFTGTTYDTFSEFSLDSMDMTTSFYSDSTSCLLDDDFAISLSQQGSSIDLKDILASPVLRDDTLPDRPSFQPPSKANVQKTVTFAPTNRALLNFSALLLSAGSGAVANYSSSSLAGALEEVIPPSPRTAKAEQEARRRSREWSRPRMGRPRAYSAGGGM
ncbi:hypothetical protein C8T65DRAFT_68318 [Cerioporus squamosus]|nr:hypothetical protein C8T65DRAFT_68318 [Cerioporus squamosus]